MTQSAVPPESAKLAWRAGFREGVSNVELHLSWDQVLVGEKLQLPHPTSLHQLESDVLRVRAQPAEYLIHIMLSFLKRSKYFLVIFFIQEQSKKIAFYKNSFYYLLDLQPVAVGAWTMSSLAVKLPS